MLLCQCQEASITSTTTTTTTDHNDDDDNTNNNNMHQHPSHWKFLLPKVHTVIYDSEASRNAWNPQRKATRRGVGQQETQKSIHVVVPMPRSIHYINNNNNNNRP
mmetsp:Transcript_31197/g.47780  ORF Transcript_31197/g.47780 Transcript_31197/m.47780 type:complete len:105 (-) Transcript_31197:203-517(-)